MIVILLIGALVFIFALGFMLTLCQDSAEADEAHERLLREYLERKDRYGVR